jgi:hypothetical protein
MKQHVERIAHEHDIVLALSSDQPRNSGRARRMDMPGLKGVVVAHDVDDETSYAIVLHEIGHILAPNGTLREPMGLKMPTIFSPTHYKQRYLEVMCDEERAAWDWARANALWWGAGMAQTEAYAYGSYADTLTKFKEEAASPLGQFIDVVAAKLKQDGFLAKDIAA